VRGDEEGDEESRVRERRRRDDVLSGDVDARKPGGRQEANEDEIDELAVPVRQAAINF
jgi:hypothetical protein